MKIFVYFALCIISIGVIFSPICIAGKEIGNGGHSIVCRNAEGKITAAWLYDLWEAENVRSPRIPIFRTENIPLFNEKMQVNGILGKISNWRALFSMVLELEITEVRKSINDLRGVQLDLSPDLGIVAHPYGCNVEQLANDTGQVGYKILRNLDIWDALPETDRAAWFVHEGLYRIYRRLGDENSEKTRKMVAMLFSTNEMSTSEYEELSRFSERNRDDYVVNRPEQGMNDPFYKLRSIENQFRVSDLVGTWVRVATMNETGYETSTRGVHNYWIGESSSTGLVSNVLKINRKPNTTGYKIFQMFHLFAVQSYFIKQEQAGSVVDGGFQSYKSPNDELALNEYKNSSGDAWIRIDAKDRSLYLCKLQTDEILACIVHDVANEEYDKVLKRWPGNTMVTFQKVPNYFSE